MPAPTWSSRSSCLGPQLVLLADFGLGFRQEFLLCWKVAASAVDAAGRFCIGAFEPTGGIHSWCYHLPAAAEAPALVHSWCCYIKSWGCREEEVLPDCPSWQKQPCQPTRQHMAAGARAASSLWTRSNELAATCLISNLLEGCIWPKPALPCPLPLPKLLLSFLLSALLPLHCLPPP